MLSWQHKRQFTFLYFFKTVKISAFIFLLLAFFLIWRTICYPYVISIHLTIVYYKCYILISYSAVVYSVIDHGSRPGKTSFMNILHVSNILIIAKDLDVLSVVLLLSFLLSVTLLFFSGWSFRRTRGMACINRGKF